MVVECIKESYLITLGKQYNVVRKYIDSEGIEYKIVENDDGIVWGYTDEYMKLIEEEV